MNNKSGFFGAAGILGKEKYSLGDVNPSIGVASNGYGVLNPVADDKRRRQKCDAVDPDNIDGYFVEEGDDPDPSEFALNQGTAIDYVKFLAREANDRGMSVGLKKGLGIVDTVRRIVQFQFNEQCTEHQLDDTDRSKGSECGLLQSFISLDNKSVFHIEHPEGFPDKKPSDAERKRRCFVSNAVGFSTLLKDGDLRESVDFCKP